MPRITDERSYGAAREKIARLGLTPLYEELRQIVGSFQLRVKEQRDANGSAEVRKMFDAAFTTADQWRGIKSGGIEHDGTGPALPKRPKGKGYPTATE